MSVDASVRALKSVPHFAVLVKKFGPPDLVRGRNVFRALVRSIIYQQVSGRAAASIFAKFVGLFDGRRFPTPHEVYAMPLQRLRKAGLSRAKALYVHDLAEKFSNGFVQHRRFNRMENQQIIDHLIEIKGVGVWTVHMLLIFTLNRMDILPTGDLGIQKGFQIVYKLKKLPNAAQMERLAKPWRTHASVASWYLWRAADKAKGK